MDIVARAGPAAAAVAVVGAGVSVVQAIADPSLAACLRSVIIHLSNYSSATLTNPQVYTHSGYCYAPPPPQVEKWKTEACSFGKTTASVCGAVGVLTYDITENQKNTVKRLAIMFSVPFDYTYFDNWFAVGFFETTRACDQSLYELMYYKLGSFIRKRGTGSQISFQAGKYTLRGTMSSAAKAEIKLQLLEDN